MPRATTPTVEPRYSTGQVARLLGVEPKTVNRWCHEGRLPAARTVGGHARVKVADVLALLEPVATVHASSTP